MVGLCTVIFHIVKADINRSRISASNQSVQLSLSDPKSNYNIRILQLNCSWLLPMNQTLNCTLNSAYCWQKSWLQICHLSKFKSMGVQVCERSKQKKMEFNANIQLVINSFETLFPDKIFSLTCFKFPDISRFSRQVVTLSITPSAAMPG